MPSDEPSLIQTHSSLLNRLKQGDEAEGWHEFYRVYVAHSRRRSDYVTG